MKAQASHGVPFADIAIISPYRKQVSKITEILRKKFKSSNEIKLTSVIVPIKVSTVEAFQGRESRVVLVLRF